MSAGLIIIDLYRPFRGHERVAFMDPAPWMEDGMCHGCEDPDIFFPENDAKATRQAKRLCARCPVRAACAEYAIDRPHLAGIWGGLTSADRSRIRRQSRGVR